MKWRGPSLEIARRRNVVKASGFIIINPKHYLRARAGIEANRIAIKAGEMAPRNQAKPNKDVKRDAAAPSVTRRDMPSA